MMKNRKNKERGFTVFELTVVITIFAITSSIVLANFNVFSAQLDFQNLTQDVAARILVAQKNATSGVLNAFFSTADTAPIYGMAFTVGSPIFTYFSDGLGISNGVYDVGTGVCSATSTTTECISQTTMTGYTVSAIARKASVSGTFDTLSSGQSVDITFKRPSPEAMIAIPSLPAVPGSDIIYIDLLSSKDSSHRTIVIQSSGQIRVYSGGYVAAETSF